METLMVFSAPRLCKGANVTTQSQSIQEMGKGWGVCSLDLTGKRDENRVEESL